MPTAVQICNMALNHIGAEARVSSIDPPDGSVEAGACADFYAQARAETIEAFAWNFTKKRATLSLNATNASGVWAYSYALPADCIRPLRILRLTDTVTVFTQDEAAHLDDNDGAPYEIESGALYTNEPDAVLLYQGDVVDTSKFTPSFASALSYMLASYITGPLVRGREGASLADSMRQRALARGEAAASLNANSSTSYATPRSSAAEARR